MACNYIITFLLRCVPALIFVCINCYPGFSFLFWRFSVFFPWLKLDFQFVYSLLVVLIWVSFFDFLSPAETNLTYSLSLIWGVAEIQFDFYLSTFVRSPTVAAIDWSKADSVRESVNSPYYISYPFFCSIIVTNTPTYPLHQFPSLLALATLFSVLWRPRSLHSIILLLPLSPFIPASRERLWQNTTSCSHLFWSRRCVYVLWSIIIESLELMTTYYPSWV